MQDSRQIHWFFTQIGMLFDHLFHFWIVFLAMLIIGESTLTIYIPLKYTSAQYQSRFKHSASPIKNPSSPPCNFSRENQ
jgi:hypothetical protein